MAEVDKIIEKSDIEKRQLKICMTNERLKKNVFVGYKNCTRLSLTNSFKSSEITNLIPNAINDGRSKVEINKNNFNYYQNVKKFGIRSNNTKMKSIYLFNPI